MVEPSIVVQQAGNLAGSQEGGAIDQLEVNADAERGARTSAPYRVGRGRRIRKQARRREDPEIVRVEDAVVDAGGQAEVVRVDDQLPCHARLPRIRNTWTAITLSILNSRHGFSLDRRCSTSSSFSNVACSACTRTHDSDTSSGTP